MDAALRPAAGRLARPAPRGTPLLAAAALLPLLTAGFVNLAARWRVGPLSGMGLATAVQAGVLLAALAAAARYPRRLLVRMLPFAAFLLWAALRSLLTPPTFEGAQNGLVYLLFGAGALLAGTLAARDPERMTGRLGGALVWLQGVALGMALLNLLLWGIPRGGSWMIGPRSLALVCLIPFHWHLARWSAGERRALLVAALWFAVIVATTSRTASAIGLVSLAVVVALQAGRRPRRAAVGGLALAASLGLAAALVAFAPPFHARFFQGDTRLQVGEYAINVSGRAAFWRLMVQSAREAPVAGQGLGSSQSVMAAEFLESDNIRHPHNDYLRLWHDLGLVGVALLLAAVASWLAALARDAGSGGAARSVLRITAGLTVLEMLLAMITDNLLIYPFFMGAAGVVVGSALGMGAGARAR